MSPNIKPTGRKEASRQEYSRTDQVRVIKEVLDGTYTYLEACRAYKLQSNQIYAWLGKGIIEEWPEIMRLLANKLGATSSPAATQLVTRVSGSDVPMIALDAVIKFKLAIADQWLREHGQDLMNPASLSDVATAAVPRLKDAGDHHGRNKRSQQLKE